jgi:hypothetical protein
MFSNYSLVSFPTPFLLRLKNIKDEKELREALVSFSEINKLEEKEVIYFYVKTILKNGFFFEMEERAVNELLFEAAYWASIKETKQKIRPKNFYDVKDKKNQKFFSKLTKAIIEALIEKYHSKESGNDNIQFSLKLSEYLEVLYEVSCVKRDRFK